MRLQHLFGPLLLRVLSVGCTGTPPPENIHPPPKMTTESDTHALFSPPALAGDWTDWIVGEWEGRGEGSAGKGRGRTRFKLALGGQFLIGRGEAEITGLDPDYLKKHMRATDEENERFRRSGYQVLEIYTLDLKTGEVIAYLFDSLRCLASGRGRRDGVREIVQWEWRTGQKSTRITERVSADEMRIVERTPNPDGSVMEDTGIMPRVTRLEGSRDKR